MKKKIYNNERAKITPQSFFFQYCSPFLRRNTYNLQHHGVLIYRLNTKRFIFDALLGKI